MRLRDLVRDDEVLARTQAERVGERVLRPFQQFARRQASGGLLLLVCVVVALVALFISGLAFPGTGLESQAKLGILLGLLASAAVGIAILVTTEPLAEPDSA